MGDASDLRQHLAACPDSYWFRMDDYLRLAKSIRRAARDESTLQRAELERAADAWEAIVCEHLDFLRELSSLPVTNHGR